MARIIVMPDATHLKEGIRGTILYAEHVAPEHLDDCAPRNRSWSAWRAPYARRGRPMNMLLTARQLERLRELPADHKLVTAHRTRTDNSE